MHETCSFPTACFSALIDANICITWMLSAQQANIQLRVCESLLFSMDSTDNTEIWRTEPNMHVHAINR